MINANDNVLDTRFDQQGQTTFRKKTGPQNNISMRQFYRYRFALRHNDHNIMYHSSRKHFHWLWFSRRLAEYFVISITNRIERHEMDTLKKVQEKKNYRSILA